MKTAIAIPVKNERKGLETLIDNLLKQMSPDDELIFVDAGSTDGTQDLIEQYASKYKSIRLLISKGSFCGSGRNTAISQANTDIIAHIDGGNFPDENWLEKICAPIKQGTADYVTGNIAFMPIPKKIMGMDINMGEIYGLSLFRGFRRDSYGKMAGGSSVAYRKWIWEKLGGFPNWCRLGGEDVLFVDKMMNLNVRETFANDALVYWQIGPGLKNILKRKFRFQAGLFTSYFHKYELLKGCFIPSVLILAIILALVFPALRLPVAGLFILEWIRQGVKISRIYLRKINRKGCSRGKAILSMSCLSLLEGLNLFARMAGVVAGLIFLRQNRIYRRNARKYLNENVAE